MQTKTTSTPTPGLDRLIARDPDLVDRLFDYLLGTMPDLRERVTELASAERRLREEFRAARGLHIRAPEDEGRAAMREMVMSMPASMCAQAISRETGVPARTVRRWRSASAPRDVAA